MLKVQDLEFSYGKTKILDNITFTASPGEMTVVLGANGSGKTTMLQCINRLNKYNGHVEFDEKDITSLTHEKYHDMMSYLDQNLACDAQLTVFEVVLLGRLTRLGFKVAKEDTDCVENILSLMGIEQFSQRGISELSGGQRQLVFIAQALVKNPKLLVMDEPTSALDLNKQFHLLDFLRQETHKNNYTTLLTLHHLDMAAKYADKLVIINDNKVYAEGTPAEVFTPKMLEDVYRVSSEVYVDSNDDVHLIALSSTDKWQGDSGTEQYKDVKEDKVTA